MNRAYTNANAVFAWLFVALGIALLVQTARAGGGIGYVLGALFIALGVGRIYLRRRGRA
jgi:hypothetical protein